MKREHCSEKVGLRKGRWTAEEDEKLINYIKQNGEGSWRSLPTKAGLLRCGKSCRIRWVNYLRTDLKRGNFTEEEDETIIKLHRSVGNKWSLIASNLRGRTDNEVKNYWNSHLSRNIYSFRSTNGSMVATLDMVKMANNKSKRKGGRVSRAVAKKYKKHSILKITTATKSSSSPNSGAISGIQEATTAAQNAAEVCNKVEERGKNAFFKPIYIDNDGVERERINSIHERCDGRLETYPELMLSPEKLEGENEVAVSNKELDELTLLLERVLEGELMDLSENNLETENEIVDPGNGLVNKDSDCGAGNTNSDTTDEIYECFSPLNSPYSSHYELLNWDAEYSVPGFGLCNEGDEIPWL